MSKTSISPDTPKKTGIIAKRFRNINLIFILVFMILLVTAFAIMLSGITGEASGNYSRFYTVETVEKFRSCLRTDLTLVKRVSRSNAVKGWFAAEDDPEKRMLAYHEILDYIGMAQSAYLYLVINESLNEYSIDGVIELNELTSFDTIDPADPYNDWYFNCINSENEYTLEVDIDKATNTARLWINHKVEDDSGLLGVFCSGLEFDEVANELFGQYNTQNTRGFIIDKNGVIQIDSAVYHDESKINIREMSPDAAFKETIEKYLGSIDGFFSSNLEPQVIRLSDGSYEYMSIAPVAGTDWSVVTFFNSSSLFSMTWFLPLLVVMLAAFVLYALSNNVLMRRLALKPLNRLTSSVSESGTGGSNIFGIERGDEIGELAKTIQNMRERLESYTTELLSAVNERARQENLLHAVNGIAVTLLAADDDMFEESLRNGLKLMADCMDVDRVYIWRNETRDGILHYIQEFEWLNENGMKGNTVHSKTGFSYINSIPEWEEKFKNAECVNGPISSLSEGERVRLEPYGIKSLLVIPVYFQDKFWGFVSFDDCRNERVFTDDEIGILWSGSLMIASAMARNETAAKMRDADERAKIMLDATPLCCNLWDKDLVNIDCNEEAVKLFGLTSKQEYLDRFFELSPEYQPDGQLSSEKALGFIKDAFENGRTVFEWMHHKLDGEQIPSEITLVRVLRGADYIVTGYTRDMREYRKMMREIEYKDTLLNTVNNVAAILLQSETDEFHNDLWCCMGMLADSVDADRVYIWKNHVSGGKLYGTQLYEWSESAEPQQDGEYTVNIPYGEAMPAWDEKLSNGYCINGMVRDLSPTEQAHLMPQGIQSILVVPVHLRDNFWGFVGFDDCHSERVFSNDEETILRSGSLLIANALLRNEMTQGIRSAVSKMEAVISNYTGIIWSVDKNNIITLFNGLYLKELGIKPDYFEGKSLEDARHRNMHFDIVDKVKQTFENAGPQEWISETDGKMFRVHTTPLYDLNNTVTGVVGSFDDITDSIRLQKELEAAVEQAQSASRAKTNFLSNMSHEMRTPMNAIIGMTMIGKAASDTVKKDYAFGKIEDASNHLLGVINDVLDMSKIEANKFDLSDNEFNFEKMLQKVVNVINFRIDEKQQHFTVYLDRTIPQTLIGDDQRLSQVIANLLSNAVKFTPELGTIKLDTYLVSEENGTCTIRIEVIDSGIGISPEQQSRLFHSFEQAESSTSRKFGGTGLGLSISKHIVELMGGKIWIESELGSGSKFAFTVLLQRGTEELDGSLSPEVSWNNINILAVDDDLGTREYFASIAEQFEIACDTAPGGDEAIELIESKGSYNIYFIDWKMPGMNGIELSRIIKSRDLDKSIIIMISATEWNIIENDAKAAGVDKFLPKPLFPSAIADCINECIGTKKSLSAAETNSEMTDSFAGHYVLLAEDVEINREIVLAMLESTELTIDCAVNGSEAVEMFSATPERYDMIFMDVQMPEMDGLEATRRIRTLDIPQSAGIPIVAMTANVFKEDIEKCIEAGMDDHVGKPLDFNEVLNKIKYYLH